MESLWESRVDYGAWLATARYRLAWRKRVCTASLSALEVRPNQLRARRLGRLSLGSKCGTDADEPGVTMLVRGARLRSCRPALRQPLSPTGRPSRTLER
jgi:hypothetical protein